MVDTNSAEFPQLVALLRAASAVVVFTGAGISTNSGIPDYRGPDGVWKVREPVYYRDFMADEAARLRYWQQKAHDWAHFRDAEPNAVHRAVVQLQRAHRLERVITQNIDGLHRKAGTDDDYLIELHGTNRLVACQRCGEQTDPQPHFDAFNKTQQAPVCHCGGYLKPATISFGQSLRQHDLAAAAQAVQVADLVVTLGTSLVVEPAASLPLLAARRGTPYVIINRGRTQHDGASAVTLRLDGDVGELFPPAVAAALRG